MSLVFIAFGCEKDNDVEVTKLQISDMSAQVSHTSVAIKCNIQTTTTIQQVNLHYAVKEDFSDEKIAMMTATRGKPQYTITISNLRENTKYYYRIGAINQFSTKMSDEIFNFTTKEITMPSIKIDECTVTYNSITATATVTDNGGTDIWERGVCYSTSTNPTIEHDRHILVKNITNGGVEQFSCTLPYLNENTKYYLRAYARNSKYIAYSANKVISTQSKKVPTVSIDKIHNVTATTATISATVNSDGGATVTERGICYGTKANPTMRVSATAAGTGSYVINLSNLSDNTLYYVRAYATNSKGTAYSNDFTFTTKEITKPVVIINSIDNVTLNSAKITVSVTNDGGATITSRGIYYGTSSNPTLKLVSVGTTGSFVFNLSSLTDNTTYYVKAFATNSKGTTETEIKTFTTSGTASSINDYLGNWACTAYNIDNAQYVSWSDVTIRTFNNSTTNTQWVAVDNLCNANYQLTAIGEYNETDKMIHLYSGWALSSYTFTSNNIVYIPRFYPLYYADGNCYTISDGAGYDGTGEAILSISSNGTLILRGATTPDSHGRVANGCYFRYYNNETGNYAGAFDKFIEMVFTKISSVNSQQSVVNINPSVVCSQPIDHNSLTVKNR